MTDLFFKYLSRDDTCSPRRTRSSVSPRRYFRVKHLQAFVLLHNQDPAEQTYSRLPFLGRWSTTLVVSALLSYLKYSCTSLLSAEWKLFLLGVGARVRLKGR